MFDLAIKDKKEILTMFKFNTRYTYWLGVLCTSFCLLLDSIILRRYDALSKNLEGFRAEGYAIEENVFSTSEISSAISFLAKELDPGGTDCSTDCSHKCSVLDASFETFKRRYGDRIPFYFRKQLHSEPFYNLIFAPELIKRVQNFLKAEKVRLYPVYMLRAQEQNKKVVEWHQDPIYTQFLNPFFKKSDMKEYLENTLNVWVPLCDVLHDQAPLRVASGSHEYGVLPHSDISDKSSSDFPVFSLRDPWLSRYAGKQKSLQVKAGSAIFFNHTLAHTSTPNRNHRIRWSLDLRFESETAQSFRRSSGFSAQISLKSWLDADSVPPLSESQRHMGKNISNNCYADDFDSGALVWVKGFPCDYQIHNCIRPASLEKLQSNLGLLCRNGAALRTFDQSAFSNCFADYRHKLSVLFAGESVTRGIFEDFLRIISDSMQYAPSRKGKDTLREIVQVANTNLIDTYFTFLTGTFGERTFESKKESFSEQQKGKYEYSFTKLQKVFKQIGAVDFTIIGAAAWDILLINDHDNFRYEMTKLIKLAMQYSSKIILRTETPLVHPSNQTKDLLHYLEYNSSLKEYNHVIYELAEEFGLMILDAYNIIRSGIRDGALKYGLMEDHQACAQRFSEVNTINNGVQASFDVDEIEESKKVVIRKNYRKNEPPRECINQHHISCRTCDDNLHSGMGSMAIAQAFGSLICS